MESLLIEPSAVRSTSTLFLEGSEQIFTIDPFKDPNAIMASWPIFNFETKGSILDAYAQVSEGSQNVSLGKKK